MSAQPPPNPPPSVAAGPTSKPRHRQRSSQRVAAVAVATTALPQRQDQTAAVGGGVGGANTGGVQLDHVWMSLKCRLYAILDNMKGKPVRTRPRDWVEIYTDFSNLYSNRPDSIKKRAYHHVRSFILELVESQLQHLRHLQGNKLLNEYINSWERSYEFVRFMKRVLHQLHHYWIWHNANNLKIDPVRPIDKLLMFYWRENLLTNLPSVVDVALELIQRDRVDKNNLDCSLVKRLVDNLVILGSADIYAPPDPRVSSSYPSSSLVGRAYGHSFLKSGVNLSNPLFPQCDSSLSLYHQLFEQPFLAKTVDYYKTKGGKPNRTQSAATPESFSTFMNDIFLQLQQEETRAKQLLHEDSVIRVRQAAQDQLIGNQLQYLQTQFTDMIQNDRHSDLNLLYNLLKRIDDGLTPVRSFFIRYIRTQGNSIVVQHVSSLQGKTTDMSQSLILIEKMVQLYLKHASMVRRCFDNSPLLLAAIDDAFRGFINRSTGSLSIPTLLAYYMDSLLRHKPKSEDSEQKTEEDVNVEKTESSKVSTTFASAAAAVGLKNDDRIDDDDDDSTTNKDNNVGKDEINVVDTKSADRVEVNDVNAEMINALTNTASEEAEISDDFWEDETAETKYMTELVRFFMYLDDKDLFCEAYRRLFAARLLSSYDETLETQFIARLEKRMGAIYTRRYRGMIQDIQLSDSLTWAFRQQVEEARRSFANSKAALKIEKTKSAGDINNNNLDDDDITNDRNGTTTDNDDENNKRKPRFDSFLQPVENIDDEGNSSIVPHVNRTPSPREMEPSSPHHPDSRRNEVPPVALRVRPAPVTPQQQLENGASSDMVERDGTAPATATNNSPGPEQIQPTGNGKTTSDDNMNDTDNANANVGSSTPGNSNVGQISQVQHPPIGQDREDPTEEARQLVEDVIEIASSSAPAPAFALAPSASSAQEPVSSSASIAIPALLSTPVPFPPVTVAGPSNHVNIAADDVEGADDNGAGAAAIDELGFLMNPGDVGDTVNNNDNRPEVNNSNGNLINNNNGSGFVAVDTTASHAAAATEDDDETMNIFTQRLGQQAVDDNENGSCNFDVSLRVLNGLHWPTEAPIIVKLPPVLELYHSLLTTFYMRGRAFRKLTWLERISSVTLEARYTKATFPVVTTPSQAALLLLFNDAELLSVEEIGEKLGVNVEETLKLLRHLTTGGDSTKPNKKRSGLIRFTLGLNHSSLKTNELNISSSTNNQDDKSNNSRKRKRISSDDENEEDPEDIDMKKDDDDEEINKVAEAKRLVCVNDKFEQQKGCSTRSEVLIPLNNVEVGNVDDVAKDSKKVVVDRNMQVDAAIVRLMKSKKECTHSELCTDVMKLLSSLFMADSRLIKSRIDRLIDMEYMQRDEEDLKIYRYLF